MSLSLDHICIVVLVIVITNCIIIIIIVIIIIIIVVVVVVIVVVDVVVIVIGTVVVIIVVIIIIIRLFFRKSAPHIVARIFIECVPIARSLTAIVGTTRVHAFFTVRFDYYSILFNSVVLIAYLSTRDTKIL